MSIVTHARRAAALVLLLLAALVPALLPTGLSITPAADAAGPGLPAGFQDRPVISGLDQPTVVDFAADGTAFVANQAGLISTVARVGAGFASTPAPFADLTLSVDNYWDRGLVGLAVDPALGTGAGRDYVYVVYAYDRDPRDPARVPAWGNPQAPYYDECAAPASLEPGGSAGCVVSVRVSRLAAERVDGAWRMSTETELLAGGCLQFPSHGSGAAHVGPDGMLYVTAGEGASFDTADYGQFGGNPCADPVNEGGSLRSQDIRTTGDPLSIDGSLLRIDPMTGTHTVAAYGLRNPWRFAFRPGTDEVWIGDVGAGGYDEVNRLVGATSTTTAPRNFGWPCFEGPARTAGWDELDLPLCESLYAGTAPVAQRPVAPYLPYARSAEVVPGDGCAVGTASVSGVEFLEGPTYPEDLQGALVFADFARGCIWSTPLGADGQPDRTATELLVGDVNPVDLTTGPEGDLYYVDYGLDENGNPQAGAGAIHRISYQTGAGRPPVAAFTPNPPYSSEVPLSYEFDASGSTDPDSAADQLQYAWDLDGDGAFDDGDAQVVYRVYEVAGPVTVSVRVTDETGLSDVAEFTIHVGNDPPELTVTAPVETLTWAVGDPIPFAATATDLQDGYGELLPDSAFTWSLAVSHCPSVCHVHPIETRTGVASGEFVAPDHEYPSHLVLRVRVTDSDGFTVERNIDLQPKTVDLTFAATPVQVPVSVLGANGPTPLVRRVIAGSTFTVSVPPTVTSGGRTWRFASWSDGGERVHQTVAPDTDETLTARYVADSATTPTGKARLTVRATPGRLKVRPRVAGAARPSGWSRVFEVGDRVKVVAPATVRRKGQVWVFRRWSDGGRRTHTVTIRTDRVLTAVYRRR